MHSPLPYKRIVRRYCYASIDLNEKQLNTSAGKQLLVLPVLRCK